MCRDCVGKCRSCQKASHSNTVATIATFGLWLVGPIQARSVYRKARGKCKCR